MPTRAHEAACQAQLVRLIDVFLLGPAMVVIALEAEDQPSWLRWFIGISGVCTTAFNGYNYLRIEPDCPVKWQRR